WRRRGSASYGRHLPGAFCQAVYSDILEFSIRVLVIHRATGFVRDDSDLAAAPLCPVVRTGSSRSTRGSRVEEEGPQIAGAVGRSVFGVHAAVSVERQLSHEADRLASRRARRAAAAPDFKSAGTALPVPKYISSGVCPRKAE